MSREFRKLNLTSDGELPADFEDIRGNYRRDAAVQPARRSKSHDVVVELNPSRGVGETILAIAGIAAFMMYVVGFIGTLLDTPTNAPSVPRSAVVEIEYLPTAPLCIDVKAGDQFVFSGWLGEHWELFIANPSLDSLCRVLDRPSHQDRFPVWSPDGSRIAFASGTAFNRLDIYTALPDGEERIRLTNDNVGNAIVENTHPAWSPTGTQLAFASNLDGGFDIHVMNANGTDRRNLTAGATDYDMFPAWSPDGRQIAFTSGLTRDGTETSIFVMDVDGRNRRQVADLGNGIFAASDAAWSPQGGRIAYIGWWADNGANLYVVDRDDTEPRQLTDLPVGEQAWSPSWMDDSTIVFSVWADEDTRSGVFQVDIETSEVERRTLYTGIQDIDWHP